MKTVDKILLILTVLVLGYLFLKNKNLEYLEEISVSEETETER